MGWWWPSLADSLAAIPQRWSPSSSPYHYLLNLQNWCFRPLSFLDPETDIMDQFLGPKTDIMDQFLGPETDIICNWNFMIFCLHGLLQLLKSGLFCSFLQNFNWRQPLMEDTRGWWPFVDGYSKLLIIFFLLVSLCVQLDIFTGEYCLTPHRGCLKQNAT